MSQKQKRSFQWQTNPPIRLDTSQEISRRNLQKGLLRYVFDVQPFKECGNVNSNLQRYYYFSYHARKNKII